MIREPSAVRIRDTVTSGGGLTGAVFTDAGREVQPVITNRPARTPAAGHMTFTRTRMLGQRDSHVKRVPATWALAGLVRADGLDVLDLGAEGLADLRDVSEAGLLGGQDRGQRGPQRLGEAGRIGT